MMSAVTPAEVLATVAGNLAAADVAREAVAIGGANPASLAAVLN
jgi:hypothetical protein